MVRYLSSGEGSVKILREDDSTLLVSLKGAYNWPPGAVLDLQTGVVTHFHPANINRRKDTFYTNHHFQAEVGQRVSLSGVTIDVIEVTEDNRIVQASFIFDAPLEDPRYRWLWWDEHRLVYQRWQVPDIGEIR